MDECKGRVAPWKGLLVEGRHVEVLVVAGARLKGSNSQSESAPGPLTIPHKRPNILVVWEVAPKRGLSAKLAMVHEG